MAQQDLIPLEVNMPKCCRAALGRRSQVSAVIIGNKQRYTDTQTVPNLTQDEAGTERIRTVLSESIPFSVDMAVLFAINKVAKIASDTRRWRREKPEPESDNDKALADNATDITPETVPRSPLCKPLSPPPSVTLLSHLLSSSTNGGFDNNHTSIPRSTLQLPTTIIPSL
jgi:hypothetical protein